jgi:hypothetical protein
VHYMPQEYSPAALYLLGIIQCYGSLGIEAFLPSDYY